MNLATTIDLYCYGTSEGVRKAWEHRERSAGEHEAGRLLEQHDSLKNQPIRQRSDPDALDTMTRMMHSRLPGLIQDARNSIERLQGYRKAMAEKSLDESEGYLERSRKLHDQGKIKDAQIESEVALMKFHEAISHIDKLV